jgi:hypothetical protein
VTSRDLTCGVAGTDQETDVTIARGDPIDEEEDA